MKFISIDDSGKRATWLMDVKNHVMGLETIANVIMAETNAMPKVVLALIEGGKK